MKNYSLDLSAETSLLPYLVEQGHTIIAPTRLTPTRNTGASTRTCANAAGGHSGSTKRPEPYRMFALMFLMYINIYREKSLMPGLCLDAVPATGYH